MEKFNGEGEGQKNLDRTAAVCFSSSYKTGRLLPTCARVALDLAAVAYVFIVSIVPGILYLSFFIRGIISLQKQLAGGIHLFKKGSFSSNDVSACGR